MKILIATILAFSAGIMEPLAFGETNEVAALDDASQICRVQIGVAQLRRSRCFNDEQSVGVDPTDPTLLWCARTTAQCNGGGAQQCSLFISNATVREGQCRQSEWVVGTNSEVFLGLRCAQVSVWCQSGNSPSRQCDVYRGRSNRYVDRCNLQSEIMTAYDEETNPAGIFCSQQLLSCPDAPPPPPPQEYRWTFNQGSNHWTGQCGPYHNSGDPSGSRCTSPGQTRRWQYAYAQGGCAPQYAVWENTYTCR